VILNLVLDARARLGDAGRLEIRSAHHDTAEGGTAAITVGDSPRDPRRPSDVSENAHFGVATVRLIARDAGGDVDVERRGDGGCAVCISLPARGEPGVVGWANVFVCPPSVGTAFGLCPPYGAGRSTTSTRSSASLAPSVRPSALRAHDQLRDQQLDRALQRSRACRRRPPDGSWKRSSTRTVGALEPPPSWRRDAM
jgi:hypothetical protein